MNLKALPLILSAVLISPVVLAESTMEAMQKKAAADFQKNTAASQKKVLEVKAKDLEVKIENEIDSLFFGGLRTASKLLIDTNEIPPFAYVLKKDGSFALISLPVADKYKKIQVNEQATIIRKKMKKLALEGDKITGYVIAVYGARTENNKRQEGIVLDLEHEQRLALMRFVPVLERKKTDGSTEMYIEPNLITTNKKEPVVFTAAK